MSPKLPVFLLSGLVCVFAAASGNAAPVVVETFTIQDNAATGRYLNGGGSPAEQRYFTTIDLQHIYNDGWSITGLTLEARFSDDSVDRIVGSSRIEDVELVSQSNPQTVTEFKSIRREPVAFPLTVHDEVYNSRRVFTDVSARDSGILRLIGFNLSQGFSSALSTQSEISEIQPFTTQATQTHQYFASEQDLAAGQTSSLNTTITRNFSDQQVVTMDFGGEFSTLMHLPGSIVASINGNNRNLGFFVEAPDIRDNDFVIDQVSLFVTAERSLSAVPLPASLPLLGVALMGLTLMRRRNAT